MGDIKKARAKATEYILSNIKLFTPGDDRNYELTKDRLSAMSDNEFKDYMKKLAKSPEGTLDPDREYLTFYSPNLDSKARLSLETNLAIADKIGHKLYQRIWMTDNHTGQEYLTLHEHLVVDMPLGRQAQFHLKKVSIPLNNNSKDQLTGQVTGASKGGSLSHPELQSLLAWGYDVTALEFAKARGGDEQLYREMASDLMSTGRTSIKELMGMDTKTRAVEVTSILFKGAGYDNNI